jgi:CcmD family protein
LPEAVHSGRRGIGMTFFLAGYIIIWAAIFLYTAAIKRGQDKLEQELSLLEELVQQQSQR